MTRPLAVGLGFNSAATADGIEALLHRVLHGFDPAQARLYTLDSKADAPVLRTAAARLGLEVTGVPAALLAQQTAVTTHSRRAVSAVGTPSVAEAAALAGAGPHSRLLVSRVAQGGVTGAIAVAGTPPHGSCATRETASLRRG